MVTPLVVNWLPMSVSVVATTSPGNLRGWTLAPVVHSAVLVLSNCMVLTASAQVCIQSIRTILAFGQNWCALFDFEDCWGAWPSPRQDDMVQRFWDLYSTLHEVNPDGTSEYLYCLGEGVASTEGRLAHAWATNYSHTWTDTQCDNDIEYIGTGTNHWESH